MITKEQIEAYALENIRNEMKCWFEGANWALEQCPYSREDMIDLLHFVRLSAPNWIIPDDKLVKHWEDRNETTKESQNN